MGSVKLHIKKSDNDKKKMAGIIDDLFFKYRRLKITNIVNPLTMMPMQETMTNPMKATLDHFSLICVCAQVHISLISKFI